MTQQYFSEIFTAQQVFTPGAPVSEKDLFAGRKGELDRVVETIGAPGRHPIIFGERGVGKTSLANILCTSISNVHTVKIGCDGSDTFDSIWNRVLSNATIQFKQEAFGLNQEEACRQTSLSSFLKKSTDGVTPSDVASVLGMIKDWAIIVLDEFDKVKDQKAKAYTADLIKGISDAQLKPTVVLIGVGTSIKDLVGEHPSISRNLVQVELKKLSDQEIREVVAKGFAKLNIMTTDDILDQIPPLANGFPHYAHLLGLSAAKACIKNGTRELTPQLFQVACDLAVQDAIEKYRDAFSDGTATTQPSRYPKMLCACGIRRSR